MNLESKQTADKIKRLISIESLLGLPPSKNQYSYQIHCPLGYHQDKTPSFTIYPGDGRWWCYGSCHTGGDVINLYQELYRLPDNTAAVKEMADKYLIADRGMVNLSERLNQLQAAYLPPVENRPVNHDIYHALQGFCGGVDAESRAYLHERGLTDETIAKFGIFSISDYKKAKKFIIDTFGEERYKESGLYTNRFIFIKNKIIIPIIEEGKIVNLRGRYLWNGSPEVANKNVDVKYKTLKRVPIKGKLFNGDMLDSLQFGDRVYLCEGELDAMAACQNGLKAVAFCGVSNGTKEAMERLVDFDLVIAYDNDPAGKESAQEASKMFYRLTKRLAPTVELPENVKDVADYYKLKNKF